VERINKQLYLQRRPLTTLHAAFEVSWGDLQKTKSGETITKTNHGASQLPTMTIMKSVNNLSDITCSLPNSGMFGARNDSNKKLFSYVCTFCVFNSTTDQPCSSESTAMSDKMFFQFDQNMLFNYVSKKDNKLKVLMTYFYEPK
jgi:hypothetical protein